MENATASIERLIMAKCLSINNKYCKAECSIICNQLIDKTSNAIIVYVFSNGILLYDNICQDSSKCKHIEIDLLKEIDATKIIDAKIDINCSFVIVSTEKGVFYLNIDTPNKNWCIIKNGSEYYNVFDHISISNNGEFVVFKSLHAIKLYQLSSNKLTNLYFPQITIRDFTPSLVDDGGRLVLLHNNQAEYIVNLNNSDLKLDVIGGLRDCLYYSGITNRLNSFTPIFTEQERVDNVPFQTFVYNKSNNTFGSFYVGFAIFRRMLKIYSQASGDTIEKPFIISKNRLHIVGENLLGNLVLYDIKNDKTYPLDICFSDVLLYSTDNSIILYTFDGIIDCAELI